MVEGQEETKQFLPLEFYLLIFKVLKCDFKVNNLAFSIFKWFGELKKIQSVPLAFPSLWPHYVTDFQALEIQKILTLLARNTLQT